MAKKSTPAKAAPKAIAKTPAKKAAAAVVSTTAVRNSAVPKVAAAVVVARPEISGEQIARRAYEIHLSGTGGSSDDNWFRAERELRGL